MNCLVSLQPILVALILLPLRVATDHFDVRVLQRCGNDLVDHQRVVDNDTRGMRVGDRRNVITLFADPHALPLLLQIVRRLATDAVRGLDEDGKDAAGEVFRVEGRKAERLGLKDQRLPWRRRAVDGGELVLDR